MNVFCSGNSDDEMREAWVFAYCNHTNVTMNEAQCTFTGSSNPFTNSSYLLLYMKIDHVTKNDGIEHLIYTMLIIFITLF